MDIVARECRYVTGRTVRNGGSGDSSILTAVGVFQGMRAAAEHLWGGASLEGRLVGVEGVGKVGYRLVEHLLEAGARVVICDVNAETAARVLGQHPGIEVAESRAALLARPLDILSPCAMGGTLDDDTVATLTARIVCGGANNQLAHPGIEKMLADRGILYAPDYVVNAGGVVQVADELAGFSFERAQARASEIFTTTRRIFTLADQEGVPPAVAADRLAELRMAEVGRLRGIWLGP
jgi:valine dehydrogenase (NAD+)